MSVQTENGTLSIQLTRVDDGQQQRIAQISSSKDSEISVDLYYSSRHGLEPIALPFRFYYDFKRNPHSLIEVIEQRNDRIKSFYSRLWFGQGPDPTKHTDSTFHSDEITLSWAMLQDVVSILETGYPGDEINRLASDVFPIDACIIIGWDTLVKPLLVKDIDVDLLRLVHRSNTSEYVGDFIPLRVGEIVSAKSHIQAISIEDAGKSIVVKAEIERSGRVVATVTSNFLCKGSYSDFASTFQHVEEPEFKLEVTTLHDQAILRDREWFLLDDPSLSLLGICLIFRLKTHLTWRHDRVIGRLETIGTIHERLLNGRLQQIGKVHFVAHDCHGNPVMDFLNRRGTHTRPRIDLKTPGWFDDASLDVIMPRCNDNYARISRDYNPIHVSPTFAGWANLPGTITHGMFTSAMTRGVVEHLTDDEERLRFRRFSTSFVGMVLPRDKLTVSFQHTAMIQGRMILKVIVHNKDTEETVIEGEAEMEQENTAYAFTGQGSQEQGMGMALYNSSPVARGVWDEADKILEDLYGRLYNLLSLVVPQSHIANKPGWSILDIVRNNPKTLTVRFGGKRGRQLRENYLNLSVKTTLADGRTVTEPLLKSLNHHSTSYAFVDAQGLLYSTQFAQPAITILEKASFEDMRSKGLVQESASFAGHSLGEYGALSSVADFIPFKALMGICFYRGLAMQGAMERDEEGRTEYAMVAVNPARVGKCTPLFASIQHPRTYLAC